eukprot:Rhum_TRINITY_DN9909_c0_g1::Rhum_TRINITY_DN9909_c0_g1_i1::g.35862::m.35862
MDDSYLHGLQTRERNSRKAELYSPFYYDREHSDSGSDSDSEAGGAVQRTGGLGLRPDGHAQGNKKGGASSGDFETLRTIGQWVECRRSGHIYYVNSLTKQSSWEQPPEFAALEALTERSAKIAAKCLVDMKQAAADTKDAAASASSSCTPAKRPRGTEAATPEAAQQAAAAVPIADVKALGTLKRRRKTSSAKEGK